MAYTELLTQLKRRETYIAVYFSLEEKEKILELTSKKGLSASSFIILLGVFLRSRN